MNRAPLLALGSMLWGGVGWASPPPQPSPEPAPAQTAPPVKAARELRAFDLNGLVHHTAELDCFAERLTLELGVSVNRYDPKQPRVFDRASLSLSCVNRGLIDQPPLSVVAFTERDFAAGRALPTTGHWPSASIDPGYTGYTTHEGMVPIGTKSVIYKIDRATAVRVDLSTGQVTSLEGRRVATATAVDLSTARPSLAYRRIPINVELAGVSMVQSGCTRYFDLGIDDVYLTHTARDDGEGPIDSVLLDASFLKRAIEPSSNPDCHRHVSLTARYVWLELENGRTLSGAEPDSAITVFGGRQTRRFATRPGAPTLRFVFGDPRTPDAVLEVDVESGRVRVVKDARPLSVNADTDLTHEWLGLRRKDPALYGLQRIYRHRNMRLDLPSPEALTKTVCMSLDSLKTSSFTSPRYELEPDLEVQKLACSGYR